MVQQSQDPISRTALKAIPIDAACDPVLSVDRFIGIDRFVYSIRLPTS